MANSILNVVTDNFKNSEPNLLFWWNRQDILSADYP